MNRRILTTVGIVAAIMMITAGADLAFARGGGGGSHNGNGSGAQGGSAKIQSGNTYQQQHKQQNQYQHKQQNQQQYRQDKGSNATWLKNGQEKGDQIQLKTRDQIRDPASHESEVSE